MANAVTVVAPSPMSADQLPQARPGRRLLVWVVGTVVILGMLSAVLLPSLCRPRESANRAKCASNLHQIGLAILLYTQENGGQYPPSLAMLPRQEQITPGVMVCPSSNDEPSSAADLAGIFAELEAAENQRARTQALPVLCLYRQQANRCDRITYTIVAYEPMNNHQGAGTNVLFGDGHAEWVDKQEWPKVATAAGVAVVESLTTSRNGSLKQPTYSSCNFSHDYWPLVSYAHRHDPQTKSNS